jgi:hypothetical protein
MATRLLSSASRGRSHSTCIGESRRHIPRESANSFDTVKCGSHFRWNSHCGVAPTSIRNRHVLEKVLSTPMKQCRQANARFDTAKTASLARARKQAIDDGRAICLGPLCRHPYSHDDLCEAIVPIDYSSAQRSQLND